MPSLMGNGCWWRTITDPPTKQKRRPTIKRTLVLLTSLALLLLLTGCGKGTAASSAGAEGSEPAPAGTTETFTRRELVLEVTQVRDVRTESGTYDSGEPYEWTVYTCYPGAELRALHDVMR